ncbi:hypothetical protein MMC31_006421 [Peltigera leucophlebia]|nr:hypothetical protein [Peltigera leucophlebia]
MNTGKCTNVLYHGNATYTCTCSCGIFSYDVGTSSLQQQCQTRGLPLLAMPMLRAPQELMPSEEEFITSRDVVLLPSTEPLIALDTGIIRREATIAPFLVQLQHARVIHVRATPASGKSTLSLLLHAHVHGCQHFKLSTGCVEHLWLYSDRHPGGIMALLKGLMDAPKLRKHQKDATEIPLEDLKEILNDEPSLLRSLMNTGFGRSFPPRACIQNEEGLANFFLNVLVTDYSKENPRNNKLLQSCYHIGWLQAELTSTNEDEEDEIVYVSPSRIHKGHIVS